MKKRKIFYFLKTKEEYDYMLAGGLIPKRGIVLIESTREIYKNNVAYSGYGPLKSYFESLRTDLLSLILDKTLDVSSMVDSINTKLQGDISDYNELFEVKLTKLQNQISKNAEDISDIVYYRDNTLVPSLEEIKKDTERLDNKYTEVLQQVSKNGSTVTSFKSTLEGLIDNILEFKSTYNNELTAIRNTIVTNLQSNTDGITEAKVRNIITETQLTDSLFATKVRVTVDPLLTQLKEEINNSLTAKVKEISYTIVLLILSQQQSSGGSQTETPQTTPENITNYNSIVEYVDLLFGTHATSLLYGTVKLGDYLMLDDGKLTINVTTLKQALNWGSNNDLQNLSQVTNSTINKINLRLNTLEAIVSEASVESKIKELLAGISTQTIVNLIDWDNVYASDGFSIGVKNILKNLGIIDENGNYNAPINTEPNSYEQNEPISGNTLNYQLLEDLYGHVQELFKSNNDNVTDVRIDNTHGVTISVRNKNNGTLGDIQTKLIIGTPENTSFNNKTFKITLLEKNLTGGGYTSYSGCDLQVTVGDYIFTFKSGICVGVRLRTNVPDPFEPELEEI